MQDSAPPRTLQFVPLNNASEERYWSETPWGGHWVFMCGEKPAAVGTCKALIDRADTWEVSLYRAPGFDRPKVGAECLAWMVQRVKGRERHRVIATVDAGNAPSLAMAMICGFERYGTDDHGAVLLEHWVEPFGDFGE